MDTETFERLLLQQEGEKLDFKASPYSFGGDGEERKTRLANFVKDILAMKNTPMPGDAHIILGVTRNPDGRTDLAGIDLHPDDADIQNILSDWVSPRPRVTYSPFSHSGRTFGVIHIPDDRGVGPCMSLKDHGRILKSNVVYVRRGSRNSEAPAPEAASVFEWFRTPGRTAWHATALLHDSPWSAFVTAIDFLDPAREFLLVISPLPKTSSPDVGNLGVISWSCVADFDPYSSSSGVLSACQPGMEPVRMVHQLALDDAMPATGGKGTWWYFARGIAGRESTLCEGSWRDWTSRCGRDVQAKLAQVARASASPFTLVAIWEDEKLIKHLDSTLQWALASMGGRVGVVILTETLGDQLGKLVDDYDAQLIEIPLSQFFSGLSGLATGSGDSGDKVILPSISGAPVAVDPCDAAWIEEDGELVHRNIGRRAPEGMTGVGSFLRGREISWYELGLRIDVERDIACDVGKAMRRDLAARKCSRINLFYAPGGGGTTLARRLLWDMRSECPCMILHRCNPRETVERLRRISSITDLPLVIMLDGSQVTDRQSDELFSLLSASNIPCVMLQLSRRFEKREQANRSFFLDAGLTVAEAGRFRFVYGREAPHRQPQLAQCARAVGRSDCTPFCMGLVAFEKDFDTLARYVSARLAGLSKVQRRVLAFVCLGHYYGQRSIPVQAFASLLQLPAGRPVRMSDALSPNALSLLVEEPAGHWRTIHYLVAEEALQEILADQLADKRTWRHMLADWAVEFVDFCHGVEGETPDDMLDIARCIFIYRDDSEMLGSERSASQLYARLLSDIPVPQARMRVLRHLVAVFPEEAHFWAHLGRFLANDMKEYGQASEALDRALLLDDSDHLLHHMKGMVLRSQLYDSMETHVTVSDASILAQAAAVCFAEARRLHNQDEHGYISEVQMRIRLIDYCAKMCNEQPVVAVSNQSDPWLLDCFESAEDLLSSVSVIRGGETPSHYEESCRAQVDRLYGNHEKALQRWDGLLNRRPGPHREAVYAPPIRRQIVWTHLARNGHCWNGLSRNALNRIVALLEENLQEEPKDERNIRLWIQAVRYVEHPPALDRLVEKVAYWRAVSNSLDATYYLYVLHAVRALSGSRLALEQMDGILDECQLRSRYYRRRTWSYEWVGNGTGANMLLHQSQLGKWDDESHFWSTTTSLARLNGFVTEISGPQAGTIEVQGGLKAFFVPSVSGHAVGRSENRRVSFFLGFSYDGPRAWSIADA